MPAASVQRSGQCGSGEAVTLVRRRTLPLAQLARVLVLLLVLHAPSTHGGAASPLTARRVSGARSSEVSQVQQLLNKLRAAEQQLLGRDSCALDVAGAVQQLLQVHAAVSNRFRTSALDHPSFRAQQEEDQALAATAAATTPAPQQHSSAKHTGSSTQTAGGQPSANNQTKRQKRRAARLRKAKLAAAWQELGRASFTLAALSASGLISEFLPPPPPDLDVAAATASLCKQLQAVNNTASPAAASRPAGRRGGSSSSSSWGAHRGGKDDGLACPVIPTTDAKTLRELEWLVTAAAAGTVQAQMALADRFLMGRGGLEANCAYGLPWLQRAAESVARQADMAGNWDLAPSFIRLRERHMDMTSPQSYAEWDEEQMAEELQAAAAFGSSDSYAQRRLGYRRLIGRGIAQDHRAAYKDFVAAADGGSDGYALYNLGIMYLRGWYVARDPAQALHYFKRALERGVGAAANAIGVLAAHGEAMPADYAAAARWFEKGANISDPDSLFNLGSLYLHGRGVKRDANAAMSYYGIAFDLGHWRASLALGELYAGNEPGLGHNCEYAEKYLWQFVSQRSGWLTEAQAALQDYDSASQPAMPAQAPTAEAEDEPTATASVPQADSSRQPRTSPADSSRQPRTSPVAPSARTQRQPRRVVDRHTQALVRYLLLAESGCEAAAENAAWMLLRGQGASGPRAMGLAAHLLYRSSMLNHTSSMVELAQLLLNESIITHPQQLQQALSGTPLEMQQLLALSEGSPGLPPGAAAATSSPAASGNASVTLDPLHSVLLQQPSAFLPPVAGATACTGFYRQELPDIMQNVSNATASAQLPTARSAQGVAPARPPKQGMPATVSTADAAGVVVWRARRAAVAWLWEANSVGDAEAAAMLGWLWHEGVLQGTKAQQEALAVIKHALNFQPTPGQQAALFLVQTLIWLEQQATPVLGQHLVAAARSVLLSVRDVAVRLRGMHPTVLDMPDGLCHAHPTPPVGSRSTQPPHASSSHSGSALSGVLAAVQPTVQAAAMMLPGVFAARGGGGGAGPGDRVGGHHAYHHAPGWWEAIGGDNVDKENLILTCLLGALAAVLWLHVRQQGQAARRARLQAEAAAAGVARGVAAGGGGGVGVGADGGPAEGLRQRVHQPRE